MSTQRIENLTIDQVQPGDWIEDTYQGHKFSGEVWRGPAGAVLIATTILRWANGDKEDEIELTALTRDAPDLRTEMGTIGRATVRGIPNVRLMRRAPRDWFTAESINGSLTHSDDDVDAWTFVVELEGYE